MWARGIRAAILLGLPGAAGAHQLPPGVAEQTVHDFAVAFDLNIVWSDGRLLCYHTHAVDSDDTIIALHQLLDGTALKFGFLRPRLLTVDPKIPEPTPEPAAPASKPRQAALIMARPTPQVTRPAGPCVCGQSLSAQGWIDGPWCQYEDGRTEYAPDRCPVPDPNNGGSDSEE